MGKYSVILILAALIAVIAVTYDRNSTPGASKREPAQDVRPKETAPLQAIATVPAEPEAADAIAKPAETAKAIDRTEAAPQVLTTPAEPFAPQAPVAVRPAPVGDFHELILKPTIGFGGKYIVLEQTGGAGSVKGHGTTLDELAVTMRIEYGDWNLTAGIERFHLEVATDTSGSGETSVREFRTLRLTPGYRGFFLGLESSQAPVALLTGSTIQWADTTLLSAVAGFRFEREFDGGRKTPFHLIWQTEASYPINIESENGPSLTSPSGFGITASGALEKPFYRHADKSLSLGLKTSVGHREVEMQSAWGSYSGELRRQFFEFELLMYLGAGF